MNSTTETYFKAKDILHESSCVNTQQNGLAERKIGHILATTRSLLYQANMPLYNWGDAVLTVAHLINRLQSKTTGNKSPSKLISQKFVGARVGSCLPQRIFSCIAYLHVHELEQNKLKPRAKKCVIVGYSKTKKGHRCYHPMTQRIYISADITFNEIEMYYQTERPQQGEQAIHQGSNMDFLTYPTSEALLREAYKQPECSPDRSAVFLQDSPPEHTNQQEQSRGSGEEAPKPSEEHPQVEEHP